MSKSVLRVLRSLINALRGAPSQAQAASYTFTHIDFPGASNTYAYGINSSGRIVGYYEDSTATAHGFLRSGGSFTPINVPGATLTEVFGINSSDDMVGNYQDATGTHGFLLSGSSFTPINVPGGSDTVAYGINARGQIVGHYQVGTVVHGFLATPVPGP